MADDRFSQIYLARGQATEDSPRMRVRLFAALQVRGQDFLREVRASVERDIGVHIQILRGGIIGSIRHFFNTGELRDVLDSITIIHRIHAGGYNPARAAEWRSVVSRIFQEENVNYRVDHECIVHFLVDEDFERSRISAIAVLDLPQLSAVSREFNQAFGYLDTDPKAAIRAIYEALEILTRLMAPGSSPRLGPQSVTRDLQPIFDGVYQDDPIARIAAGGLLRSFSDWVVAAQQYRHGQEVEEPSQPSMELAVQFMSSGAGFLRWLGEIYRMQNS